MTAIPEPEDGSIVAWFDPAGDIYAVLQRSDNVAWDGSRCWFAPVVHDADPMGWQEALDTLSGFGGPVLLASEGRVAA